MKHINQEELKTLEGKLMEEKGKLIEELSSISTQDPENPDNWQPVGDGSSQTSADSNKRADNIEEYESNTAIVNDLESRLLEVNNSLSSINSEAYGICKECNKEIPTDRLMANPAATTCIDHS